METTELQVEIQPAITFLNLSGDVTITWDPENEEAILALVQQKMKEGFSFFVVKPRAGGLLGTKKVAIKSIEQARAAGSVVIKDAQISKLLPAVQDAAVAEVVATGKARLTQPAPKEGRGPVERVRSATEVLGRQTIALRPVVGG